MRSAVANWMGGLRHRRAQSEVPGWPWSAIEIGEAIPAWEDLRLEVRDLAEGSMLELAVDRDGNEVGRCLARRDGTFLREPTGPSWARRVLVEAVAEWRLLAV